MFLIETGPTSIVVNVRSETDISTVDTFLDALLAACGSAGSKAVIVDLRRCRFMDCACLTALLTARKRNTNVSLSVVLKNPSLIHKLFSLTNLLETFHATDGDGAAIAV